ncbi:threonine/serine exporter [Psychromonas sp. RZ22]|uniref:threonine/serine ThrE exporter family protein n=1 Tax=Psychromonas algarum TaxID=2555643 RepID=UPI0010673C94|nr:threonine/serine exporter family protein [Psychromonas sp. RZ22]TEW53650.1 threonine/serine exporter [Psychromonas sp. RZ22]
MNLSKEQQTELTRIAVLAGQTLHQHGAESRLIEQTTQRLGLALGADNIELSISPDAIVVTTLISGHCVTTTRRCFDRGINMQMVCDVQRICVMAEKKLLDAQEVKKRLQRLKPFKHNRWLVVLMIGFSCASFSHFFDGDTAVYWTTFVASSLAMLLRQELAHRHHNPFVIFASAAFVATTVTSLGVVLEVGEHPQIAMAASVLLLVPGFPLINAVSDMLKGYISMGIARWVFATLLAVSVSIGIVAAMTVTGVSGWAH